MHYALGINYVRSCAFIYYSSFVSRGQLNVLIGHTIGKEYHWLSPIPCIPAVNIVDNNDDAYNVQVCVGHSFQLPDASTMQATYEKDIR
jgi:hypothetical protein